MNYLKVIFSIFTLVMAILLINEACFADEALYIDSNGNVGIGTTSPDVKLDVFGKIRSTVATTRETMPSNICYTGDFQLINTDTTTDTGVLAIGFSHETSGAWADAAIVSFAESAGNTRLGFYTENGNSSAERVTIANNGNVGIGTGTTAAPQQIFEISSNTPYLRITDTTSGSWNDQDLYGGIEFYTDDPSGDGPQVGAAIKALHAREGTGHTNADMGLAFYSSRFNNGSGILQRMIINCDGKVGIGISNPSYKLDVNGTISCSELVEDSDERLKKNVNTITNALSNLSKLRGVSYEWTDNTKEKRVHFGVIASEIEKVYPDLVYSDQKGYKSVAYSKLIAPIIEAIKELKAENELLRKRIKALEMK